MMYNTLLLREKRKQTLSVDGILALLVLGHLVKGVLPALAARAESLHGLGNGHHCR